MGKITRSILPKHKETRSPWLKDFIDAASSAPLPLLPQHLEKFPTRWPFPRGDLHHWIPLLNRFDNLLESVCTLYGLHEGFQTRDFGAGLLLGQSASVEYRDDQPWTRERLAALGYKDDGDRQLLIAVLRFSSMLLEHCGNRSVYASSLHLSDLLNSTSNAVVRATLEVSFQLATRYQASVKRVNANSTQVNKALLANHYQIELEHVQHLASPFVKTPLTPPKISSEVAPATPNAAASKGKEKATSSAQKSVASVYANDLVAVASASQVDEGRWNGWGDVKIMYYPTADVPEPAGSESPVAERPPGSTLPATPTPLRRSSTGISPNPRSGRVSAHDDSPIQRTPGGMEDYSPPGPKYIELRQSKVLSTSIYDLLNLCPEDAPNHTRYELLNRLRISKALLGSSQDRQDALAVRLLAALNLSYIYPEQMFIEKVLKQDNDEPRRYQLVYQLTELIHPSESKTNDVPLWLQAIALELLEAMSSFHQRYADVVSALNANVNHGVLLYVVRKAVADMAVDPPGQTDDDERETEADQWRTKLLSLTLQLAVATRVGADMVAAGLLEILVDLLKLRSKTAARHHFSVMQFLDTFIYTIAPSFTPFANAGGLDAVSDLMIDTVKESRRLVAAGRGTTPEFHAHTVDYELPYFQQQALKWLLRFLHHVMTAAFSYGGNTDRLLRNLADNSNLLTTIRDIIKETRFFGSVVWTNAASLLGDFINNDPTSFAALSEAGMIQMFLECITGRPVSIETAAESAPKTEGQEGADPSSTGNPDDSITLEHDDRPHPPTLEMLEAPRSRPPGLGVFCSAEAMTCIPQALNSISLNNLGMRMVVSSRAVESYLEIFESPDHVRFLDADIDLVANIGGHFDELARHHPQLRPAMSNAIIDMVARVAHMAKTKASSSGWGAKLQVMGKDGKPVAADEKLEQAASNSDKGKSSVDDTDIEMTDAVVAPSSGSESSKPTPSNSITPFILVLATFLHAIFANNDLKSTFVREGGIELLLDIAQAPSLPHDFLQSRASRTLSQVSAQLIEVSQILGVPSLLNRIQTQVDILGELATREGSYPYFSPFLVPDVSVLKEDGDWDPRMVRMVAGGTKMVKALLNFQILIKILYGSFPYSSRTQVPLLPSVNVYDYYVRLVKSLGPLSGKLLREDRAVAKMVPSHWAQSKSAAQRLSSSPGSRSAGEEITLSDLFPGSFTNGDPQSSDKARRPTAEEQSTTQFQNYDTMATLLYNFVPSTYPFFQTIGKALLHRRSSLDSYARAHHLTLAEVLADNVLERLNEASQSADPRHLIVMLHGVQECLVDTSSRVSDRSALPLIIPVLVAFKERGGIATLNSILERCAKEIAESSKSEAAKSEADLGSTESSDSGLATVALRRILEVYLLIVNGKHVHEAFGQINLGARSMATERNKDYAHQLTVDLRMAVLPAVRQLWDSTELIDKTPPEILAKIIEILKTILAADQESTAYRKSDKASPPVPIFKDRSVVKFNWLAHAEQLKGLSAYPEDLAREGVYRANGKADDALEYCHAHDLKLAGARNPIPEEDAFQAQPSPESVEPSNTAPAFTPELLADPMSLDSAIPEINRIIGDVVGDDEDSSDGSDAESPETASPASASASATATATASQLPAAGASSSTEQSATKAAAVTKEDLDKERAEFLENLIDRCLEIVAKNPNTVFDVADLINNTVLKADNEQKRFEVGEVIANALMSLTFQAPEDMKSESGAITAYAHLLSLLLQQPGFFKTTLGILKDQKHIAQYLSFLKLPAGSTEELPPWIPYILLIFEILLSDDVQPVETRWKPPTSENDAVEPPVWVEKDPSLDSEHRTTLLCDILELLPRAGKDASLAISILRILVILTRDNAVAKTIGEQKNLQRLFVMAKQLCGGGASRLRRSKITDTIMIILRHITEDEETIRQLMKTEIVQFITNTSLRTARNIDVNTYLRQLSHVALRAPKIFVQVSTDLLKITRWVPQAVDGPPRAYSLALKDEVLHPPAKPKDASVESAAQATEDVTMKDVKLSTEGTDKDMTDVPKTPAHEIKRPVLENPDGVIHFLLCELLKYKEIEDKEPPSQAAKEYKGPGESSSTGADVASSSGDEQSSEAKDKDMKASKTAFKSEDHPIFIYRCFLLNCLTELLRSFTRAKVEFINFKRSAPIQTNTPIKPRSSVLNYLLNDLLCCASSSSTDPVTSKKKAATASFAQNVLVALVTRTGEKPVDRTKDNFEYDPDDPDLLFVRRFVLDTVLRAYKEAGVNGEPFEVRYQRMISLAELMSQMIGEKDRDSTGGSSNIIPSTARSQAQIKRLMYEKGYLAALTASIAEIDLTSPHVKRAIKYILRVLKALTKTAFQLSQSDVLPAVASDSVEDEILSSSSLSDLDDDREETPDLYRNSTLGMLEPGRDDDEFSEGSHDDDDDMYDDEAYDDELDYGEGISQDGEDVMSDEEEEELGEMGEIEGLSGQPGVVEVIMDHEDDEDDDMDDMDDDDDDGMDEDDDDDEGSDEDEDEDDGDSDEMDDDVDNRIEIVDEDGNAVEDDGNSAWESDTDEEDDEGQDEIDYEAEAQDLHEAQMHGMHDGTQLPNLPQIIRAAMNGDEIDGEDVLRELGDYDDGEDEDEGEEDDMDEDDLYDHEFAHEDYLPADMPAGLGWDDAVAQTNRGFRHARSPFPTTPFNMRDPIPDFRSYIGHRHHHSRPASNPAADEGVNPLLLPANRQARESQPRLGTPSNFMTRLGIPQFAGGLDGSLALFNDLNELMQSLPLTARTQQFNFHIARPGPRGEMREVMSIPLGMFAPSREPRSDVRRDTYQEPSQAVAFSPEQTMERWVQETRMIFGTTHENKSAKLYAALLANLAPAAIQHEKETKAREDEEKRKREEERKRREEELRKEREAKEAEEKAAREKKEAEERERLELERAEAAALANTEAENAEGQDEAVAMEGVETGETGPSQTESRLPRVVTTIRGETVDVTELGIDPDYLAALPEEFREEVIAQTVSTRRSEAREQASNEGETEVFQEFLEALPDELREEIIQQERQERRRRQRDERQLANTGRELAAEDMDAGSILLTFPPALREQVLLEQGVEILDQLGPELAAEARALAQRHAPHATHRAPPVTSRSRDATRQQDITAAVENKMQKRSIVQMLDKPGVATLLRLMFVTQQGSIRGSLHEVFIHVCENKQNRLEVISTLLQILQDGSHDMNAVERSFSQLSLKAKQPRDKDAKTPNSLKRTLTNISTSTQTFTNSEVSPLLVVQQCLDLLVELADKNPHIPQLFLTEHETVASTLKRSLSRAKDKGKAKESNPKAQKFAINSLLVLLDRSLIMESSTVMQLLADLLNKVTIPLQAMEKRRKEAEEEAKKSEAAAAASAATEADAQNASTTVQGTEPASGERRAEEATANTSTSADTPAAASEQKPEEKKIRPITPPNIPEQNLKLVINIFVARECSSKTFQNTISTIKNLSCIPDAKKTFGDELVRQATQLSENIVRDLDDLLPYILKAESGTEIQGVALTKFSPGASEQNKLLRVLTALDHLFDTKGKKADGARDAEGGKEYAKGDLLGSLYRDPTFGKMWDKLGVCLRAIRERESMLNVATMLLPLIESLMVVCKNTTLGDAPQAQVQASKEMLLSSPPPENRIADLFFTFTEEHRRILNELVRQNPKLMSGTFSLLVKNPKVLEFDNKRNYFNRSVHAKTGAPSARQNYQPLGLSVRREHVFHDSFKSLYFKTGPEMKFGKLNIRFHGEEGVDAGGVTREWFQVLARQMFDPNYALFIPVSSDRTTFHPNKLSGINDEHLMFFKFIGRIIGKALYEGRLLDCYFSRAVYKRILGNPVSVKDMESFDPDYYKSLVWMLENDITDIIVETFSVEDDEFGVTKVVDLIENGRNIAVTEENKHEYVRLIVEHKLLTSVKEQMEHFLKGFHDIIPEDLIGIFNEQELELLISGLPDIDVDDWKGNTEYHNYTSASHQIQWFWRAVRSFDKEERAKLLQFVTGTSKVPLNGFKELEGMNGVSRFNIHRDYGNKDRLPSSHTCFNQLDLPEYESYEILRSQLLKAITTGSDYFGFA
ncbi:E3 ubiquitin protein ligase [Rhypophila decipiens]|uniref:HECT-type E3 ubiquitin transferase n=1 Tax=Rhypophila decipiens TaxID=261697 RepID=A0AAN6Y8U4_9PEZI|nr:E3 ubiquitin protein ligase [Rhypophila decipiens]